MELKEILINGCKELSININNNHAEKFIKFKELLILWNQKINLTTITQEEEIITKHFLDSISVLKYINLSGMKILDVGTGAGFPGLPINIVLPDTHVTLLDSLNKRIEYLKEVKEALMLENIEFIWGRAEDFGVKGEYREQYDISISRAVANMGTLSEYCLPFVKIGGYFISLKGPDIEDELKDSIKAIDVLGGKLDRIEKVKIPYTDITHSIVFIKKIKQTPSGYPRKAGKPSKEPIR